MTPFEIGILLHYYSCADDHEHLLGSSEARQQLEVSGLVRQAVGSARKFDITDRGRAYVDALLHVKLPVAVWVMPDDPGTPLGEATSLYSREG